MFRVWPTAKPRSRQYSKKCESKLRPSTCGTPGTTLYASTWSGCATRRRSPSHRRCPGECQTVRAPAPLASAGQYSSRGREGAGGNREGRKRRKKTRPLAYARGAGAVPLLRETREARSAKQVQLSKLELGDWIAHGDPWAHGCRSGSCSHTESIFLFLVHTGWTGAAELQRSITRSDTPRIDGQRECRAGRTAGEASDASHHRERGRKGVPHCEWSTSAHGPSRLSAGGMAIRVPDPGTDRDCERRLFRRRPFPRALRPRARREWPSGRVSVYQQRTSARDLDRRTGETPIPRRVFRRVCRAGDRAHPDRRRSSRLPPCPLAAVSPRA